MLRRFHAIVVVLLITTIAGLAGASTVQVRDSTTSSGLLNPSGTIRATATGGSFQNITAGAFILEADYNDGNGFVPLVTYCIEPTQTVGFGVNPPDTTGLTHDLTLLRTYSPFNDTERNFLETLWFHAFDVSLTSSRKAAAFQMLVWEITSDDVFNLNSGDFKVDHVNSAFTDDAYDIASQWSDNIFNNLWTGSTTLYVLSNPDSQNFLTTVPEPASVGLLALGGMLLTLRRRRRNV